MSKVLMIEDEADLVRFFEETFRSFSEIQFFSALRGCEGVEIAKRERPRVLLLDLRMPGFSGEAALKELKTFLPESKFIIMTAWNDGETKERLEREVGVDAYFEKPVDLERVMEKILNLAGVSHG